MIEFPTPNADGSCTFSAEQMSVLKTSLQFLTADPKGAFVVSFAKAPLNSINQDRLAVMGRFLFSNNDALRNLIAETSINVSVALHHAWYTNSLRDAAFAIHIDESVYQEHWSFVANRFAEEIGKREYAYAIACLMVLAELEKNHEGTFEAGTLAASGSRKNGYS